MKRDHPGCRVPRTHEAEPGGSLRGLLAMLLAFYALWTGWALVILQFPSRLDGSPRERLARAAIGLVLFLGPALVYIRHVERRPVVEFLRLREEWGRGLALGLGVAAICLGPVIAWRLLATDARFVAAPDSWGWLNPVLFGPFKEEVLFRGVVFRRLDEGLPAPAAAILSALLYAAVHLPYWGRQDSAVRRAKCRRARILAP